MNELFPETLERFVRSARSFANMAHSEVLPGIGGRAARAPGGAMSVLGRQQTDEGDEPGQGEQHNHSVIVHCVP